MDFSLPRPNPIMLLYCSPLATYFLTLAFQRSLIFFRYWFGPRNIHQMGLEFMQAEL
jgi:hypothetical protein